MDMNRNSVAQLISRARIGLRDALRGTALASIATSSADCERAVSLLAARQDRQRAADGDWLARHLLGCETCRLSREAMEEAGASYRAWLPIAAGPALFRETMASAAEAAGADWSDVMARHEAAAHGAADATAEAEGARASVFRHRRPDAALIVLFALLLVVVVFAGAAGDDTPSGAPAPIADDAPAPAANKPHEPRPTRKPAPAKEKRSGGGEAPAAGPDRAEPATGDVPEQTSNAPTTPSNPPADADTPTAPERTERGSSRRSGGRGGGGSGISGGSETPAIEPPPPPPPEEPPIPDGPPEPPAEEPRIEDPQPPPPPPGCRDAQGIPIPCGPTRPRQPPPRLAPPP
jgi:hypothetical protein